jgi:hypothetical protein
MPADHSSVLSHAAADCNFGRGRRNNGSSHGFTIFLEISRARVSGEQLVLSSLWVYARE